MRPFPPRRGRRAYDEAWAAPGVPRPHYAALLERLAGRRPGARCAADVARRTAEAGVAFGEGAGPGSFEVDLVPRILPPAEWARARRRARAAGARAQRLPGRRLRRAAHRRGRASSTPRVIDEAEGYEPELQGRLPAGRRPRRAGRPRRRARPRRAAVRPGGQPPRAVRASPTPSRPATRSTPCSATSPDGLADAGGPVRDAAPRRAALRRAGAAPRASRSSWCSPTARRRRAGGSTSRSPRWLGAPAVTLSRPRAPRGADLGRAAPDGAPPAGRRRLPPLRRGPPARRRAGALTPLAELLLEPWLAGTVAVVNAFGTGLGDDKLVHAHVEEMIRFYLGEEPLSPSVPARRPRRRPRRSRRCWPTCGAYVVKPRHGAGRRGRRGLRARRGGRPAAPGRRAARPRPRTSSRSARSCSRGIRPSSTAGSSRATSTCGPTWSATAEGTRALPGGLTRVALDEGALVVNSHQNGGAKATWVLS